MSITVQAWVYQHSEARLADRLVLLAIADEADDDGTGAFPSLRRIAHKARVAVGTASEAVRRLEAAGVLEVDRPERTGRGHFNRYRVLMGPSEGSDTEPSGEPRNDQERAETRGNARPRGGTNPLTHQPTNPSSSQPSVELVLVEPSQEDAVGMVFEAWKTATGHPRAKLDAKRRRVIQRALKDFAPEELAEACVGVSKSPFHQGQNERGVVYDGLELVLRDAEHIERFIGIARGQAPPRLPAGSDMTQRNLERIRSQA